MTDDNTRYDSPMTMLAMAPTLTNSLVSEQTLKRFRRPETPLPTRITESDLLLLSALAQFRYLTTHQLARRAGRSEDATAKRLRRLFASGFVDRPIHQHAQLAALLNPPLVYSLTRKGARELTANGRSLDYRLDWTFRDATNTFLAHTLEVADVMLAFHFAARQAGAPRLVDHHELLPLMPAPTRELRDPFKLSVHIRHDFKPLTLSVVPDRCFSLVYPAENFRHNFCLELDRGQMSVGTKSTKLTGKSSIRKKLIAYFHAHQQKKHTDVWGMQGFRVLTITASETRINHMLEAQREVTNDRAPQLFMYSTPHRITEHGVFGPAWITAQADGVSIIKQAITGARS